MVEVSHERGKHEHFIDTRAREIRRRHNRKRVYSNASEVIRESLRLLKEHDEMRVKWRDQIERGWLQAQRGESQ